MEPKNIIQNLLISAVKKTFSKELSEVSVEHPDNEKFGDYSTNICLRLSKDLNQSPMEIAKKLHYELMKEMNDKMTAKLISSIEIAAPGFINFKLTNLWLKELLSRSDSSARYYKANIKSTNLKLLLEFSQPNPNKPMHVGHARNNFLGVAISNIYNFLGFEVIKANYMNDWGTHICKSMLMYMKYGEGKEPDKKQDHFVGDFYIMYEKMSDTNAELETELAQLFQKMEAGDPETIDLWKKITNWVYEGWEKTYKDQGVEFDVWFYQSEYKNSGKEVVDMALKNGIAERDETGAVIARLEKYGLPDKVLLRRDGTSVYATQDLQMAKDGYDKYRFDKRIYVVDFRQTDYFKQIFLVAKILGFEWAGKLVHLPYGTVDLPEGKMSSRAGLVTNSDDVLDRIIEVEKTEIEGSIKGVSNPAETVKIISMAAFKYGMLKVDPSQDIIFDVNSVCKFDGNTGPYLLYTYARGNSVLEKSGETDLANTLSRSELEEYEMNEKERQLLSVLYRLSEVVELAAEKNAPNVIANYAFEISQRFNSFYAEVPILNADSTTQRKFRLLLTDLSKTVLKDSLNLLGIQVVEKM